MANFHALRLPMLALPRALELRIDVDLPPAEIERELDALHGRIARPGDRLHAMPALAAGAPGLRLRYREADGEYYVYVEDVMQRRLAGYTVFNRLIEVGRRADPWVRAPHTKFAPAYQRRGLARALYRWALDGGLCLLSGARQSAGAHALWQALAPDYAMGYVDLRGKTLTWLGDAVDQATREGLHTRMLLLGRGWTLEAFMARTGMY
ncbi:N-acetyltransferase [Cupriavidus necator]|uniref:N-acetyltransferase n=1 Tax=Cupriavidus necator TaxID=106590 RepID=UPI00148F5EBD|nr:N-acetyltransferase [Cupriavidus necator]NOV24713.1 N-acetyltransferase [Cupriavidus necator]